MAGTSHNGFKRYLLRGVGAVVLACLAACAGQPLQAPPPLASGVDAHRMSGQWFLIAHVPTAEERDQADSSIELVERQDGSFDELYHYFDRGTMQALVLPRSRYEPVAGSANRWVSRSRALGTQVELGVVYVDPDYRYIVIGATDRRLGWIYARQPDVESATYGELVSHLGSAGYDVASLHRLPHSLAQAGRPQYLGASRDGTPYTGGAAP
mgnify:CR=1 FL=1